MSPFSGTSTAPVLQIKCLLTYWLGVLTVGFSSKETRSGSSEFPEQVATNVDEAMHLASLNTSVGVLTAALLLNAPGIYKRNKRLRKCESPNSSSQL